MSTESELQKQFAHDVAILIQEAERMGFGVTLGEAWRTPEMAKMYADQGKGISGSLHIRRLAIDLNLWKDNEYLKKTEDHAGLGAWWKSLGPEHCWGGDWGDGNHYSITPDGGRTK